VDLEIFDKLGEVGKLRPTYPFYRSTVDSFRFRIAVNDIIRRDAADLAEFDEEAW
jgi:hypothetical protein